MISDNGPQISEIEIIALEEKIGAEIPDEYRGFLLSNNGGRPEPDGVEVPGYDETDVQILFGLGRSIRSSCIDWNMESLRTRLPELAIPIASDSGGNVFCLSIKKGSQGSVFYLDLNSVFGDDFKEAPMYEVSSTFVNFMESLFE